MRYNYKKKDMGFQHFHGSTVCLGINTASKVACRMTGIKMTKDKGKMYMIYRMTGIILNGTSIL
jgi:hypothetical protein